MKKKVCSECKGIDIETLYWVNPNTKEVKEPYRYGMKDTKEKRHYCNNCMEFVTVEDG